MQSSASAGRVAGIEIKPDGVAGCAAAISPTITCIDERSRPDANRGDRGYELQIIFYRFVNDESNDFWKGDCTSMKWAI